MKKMESWMFRGTDIYDCVKFVAKLGRVKHEASPLLRGFGRFLPFLFFCGTFIDKIYKFL